MSTMRSAGVGLGSVLAALLIGNAAQAQVVQGNEAVQVQVDGSRRVVTAPLPVTGRIRTPCRADAGCHPGPWHMVETAQGSMECTEAQARPGTCRASTYGATALRRLWVVLAKGVWLQCEYPDLSSRCVPVFARPPANLPFDAVQ